MDYIYACITGGVLCVIAQLLIDYTKLTPARILVAYVTSGVILTAIGVYDKIVEFGGAGATGVKTAIDEVGAFGILSGGVSAAAAGIAAVIVFGYIFALIFKPGAK